MFGKGENIYSSALQINCRLANEKRKNNGEEK